MAKLASLVVDLQLQSAQLRQGLDEANRKLEEFAKQSQRTGNILAGAISFDVLKDGLSTLAGFVKGGADMADAMGELASSVGVPVEELSKLSYAAAFSGSSTEAVGKALAKTAAMMAKALVPTSEQAAAFEDLGVSATDADGRLRATEAVFGDIAQRFAETQDGAAKTALAVKLFGEEGAKLIPLLNNGKAGLAAFGEEAERTGNVITEKGAASAGQFNDALDRLKKAGEGLALRVAQDLAPSMAALAENLTNGKGSAEAFATAATALAGAFRVLASAGVAVGATFESVGETLAGIGSSVTNLLSGDLRAADESSKAAGVALRRTWSDTAARLKAIWETSGPGATMAADAEKAKPSADVYVSALDRTKKAAEHAAAAQKKLSDESAKALDEYVKSALALERQHAAIDRAVQKRRAEVDATAGFADMEDALERMAAAQKAVLTLRARASERETGGDLIGADRATRKADELAELAERASDAVDAFRAMGREAEEAAARLLDEQVAAAAALERTFDEIDREVAARRASPAEDPTRGFAGFNAALDAMAEALKREATLRAEAGALERAGELGEARQTLLAAEASRALAEHASAAADALAELEAARAAVPGELGGMLAGGLGSTTSATLQGVETGAAAGPVGAVVGGLVGLLSQSEQFQGALASLEEIFQVLSDSVGALVEPLLPLLAVVSEVAAGLGALLQALSPIVEFVARPLFEVLKAFGIVVLGLVKMIGEVINAFVKAFGGKGFDLSGIDKALQRLERASYDSAREQQKVAEAARATTEATMNVPSWWKVDLARFNAADPESGMSGGGTTVVNDNSTTIIQIPDVEGAEEVAQIVLDRLNEKKERSNGSRYGDP